MQKTIFGIVVGIIIGMFIGMLLPEQDKKHDMHQDDTHTEHEEMHHDDEHGHEHGEHDHEEVAVDESLPIPAVSFELFSDTKSGYNIKITTENFIFKPEAVNTEYVANEGHAHLYINGEKIARIYEPWFHIDEKYLTEEKNTIEITLNGNDHSELTYKGNIINDTKEISE